MTKTTQDFEHWRKGHLNINFVITGSDSNVQDLTSFTACWILEEKPGSGSLMRKETSGSGITITGAASGQLQISTSPSDWSGLDGHYYHELLLADSASDFSLGAIGTVLINK